MANGISNIVNSRLRLTGLSSGIDTDGMIQQLMQVERMKVDKLKQDRQLLEWKRDDYRSITNALRSFNDKYFNVAKSSTYMLSPTAYQKYTSTSSDPTLLTASGGEGAAQISHKIEVIDIATASSATSQGTVSGNLQGNVISGPIIIDEFNKSFSLEYNGTKKTITLQEDSYSDAQAFIDNGLAQKVQDAFNGNVNVTVVDNQLKFDTLNKSDTVRISSNPVNDNFLSDVLKLDNTGTGSSPASLTITAGKKFNISIVEGGITKTKEISWDSEQTYTDADALSKDIQDKITAAFGWGEAKINITADENGKLNFEKTDDITSFTLSERVKNTEVVGFLGFASGDSNKLSLTDSMSKVSLKLAEGAFDFNKIDSDGKKYMSITINDESIDVYETDTLKTFLSKVNNSSAGVDMSYSSFSDTFTLKAKKTGSGTISLNDNGSGFFTAAKLTNVVEGTDASFKIDGVEGTRNTNNFTVDGITYNILKKPETPTTVDITLKRDVDSAFDLVKSFVDDYNKVLDSMYSKTSEKREKTSDGSYYLPLTDEQKEAMSEKDIELWEKKAQVGLLRSDSLLDSTTYNMRKGIYDPIYLNYGDTSSKLEYNISSIGITTGSYLEKGKLIIDEDKLKKALEENPDKVMNLFAKESSVAYSRNMSSEDRKQRYAENGIVARIYDVIQDNISIFRDKNGRKGLLLEKAGIAGDITESKNFMNDAIDEKDSMVERFLERLQEKEQRYYKKFSAMEVALSRMNSQSSWLAQQMGMQ